MNNPINTNPYKIGNIQYIEIAESLTSENPDRLRGFLQLTIQKYLFRYPNKNGVEDLRSAQWFLNRLIMNEEKWAEEAQEKVTGF